MKNDALHSAAILLGSTVTDISTRTKKLKADYRKAVAELKKKFDADCAALKAERKSAWAKYAEAQKLAKTDAEAKAKAAAEKKAEAAKVKAEKKAAAAKAKAEATKAKAKKDAAKTKTEKTAKAKKTAAKTKTEKKPAAPAKKIEVKDDAGTEADTLAADIMKSIGE